MNQKGLLLCVLCCIFNISSKGQKVNLHQADSLVELEQYEAAIKIYKTVNQSFLKQEAYSNYLSTSIILAENLDYIEQTNEAITYLNQAILQSLDNSKEDSLIALAYHKLANIHYSSFFDDRRAISNWQKAINIRTKIFPSNHLDIIKGHRNIGNGWLNLNEWEKAKNNLQHSIDLNLSRLQIDSLLLTKAYNNLGWTYTNLEDYNKAEKLLNLSLNYYLNYYAEEPWELIDIYENLAELYRLKEEYSQAILFHKKILEVYNSFENKWEEDYVQMAISLNNLGLIYDLIDSSSIALNYHLKSIEILNTFVKSNEKLLGYNYNNLTGIYIKRGQLGKAIDAINTAIELDLRTNDKLELAGSLNNKSDILLKKGEIKKALLTINESIILLQPNQITRVIPNKAFLVIALNDKLKILSSNKEESYLKQTPEVITQIIDLTNQIRTDYQSDESKSFLSKKSKPIFENAIQTILQLYQQTKDQKYIAQAFQLAEQAKSIILMDALQQAQARQTTDVPSVLLDKENTLKRQIAAKEKALFLETVDANQLNNDLILLTQALEKLTDTLKQNYPKYHEAKYTTELPTITEIQKTINGNLLEYFVGDSTIYAFKISKEQENIDYVEIPINFPLAAWIKQLREAIYKPHLQKLRSDKDEKEYAKDLVNIAYQLHQKLVAPIIKPSERNEKLIIIPDGILGYIPFDVLISQAPEEATLFGAHDYLINDFQISYAYSATSLIEMQQKQFAKAATKNFTAFAPSFEGKNEVAFVRSIDDIRGELSPLKYNIPEVSAIQQIIGGNLFTGKEATRANFIQNAFNSKIVHLATHGKANDETGDYAYLAFTDTKDSIDFKLYNRDLYNLELNADMVVLSACETGIGELQKGEGIISLARGFSYAGAKSIITTLWSINDNKTKEIMESFYGYIKEGQTKDAALRQAKLDFIEEYSHEAHPFFWAAFIPIGDMGAIEFGNDWLWKFGLVGIIGLLFFLFWIKRK